MGSGALGMEFQYYGNYDHPPRRMQDQPLWDEEDNLSDRRTNGHGKRYKYLKYGFSYRRTLSRAILLILPTKMKYS